MAVTLQESTQYTQLYTTKPATPLSSTDYHGVVRCAYFTHTQSGAGDATSSVALAKLPPGRVRLLLGSCRAWVDWTTASATLDLGWDAYTDLDGAAVAADPDGMVDGLNVDTAGYFNFEGALAATKALGGTKLFESKGGVVIRATSQDVALAASSVIAGYLQYVQD